MEQRGQLGNGKLEHRHMNFKDWVVGRPLRWWSVMRMWLQRTLPMRLHGLIRCLIATIWLRYARNEKALHRCKTYQYWWPERESNLRHADFQSAALPTELSGHITYVQNNF